MPGAQGRGAGTGCVVATDPQGEGQAGPGWTAHGPRQRSWPRASASVAPGGQVSGPSSSGCAGGQMMPVARELVSQPRLKVTRSPPASRCCRGWNIWSRGTRGSGLSVFLRLPMGPVVGERLLEWVGVASEEGGPVDHEEPSTKGCWAHGGARKPLPRTRPRPPVCSFSPERPLPHLLLLRHRGWVFRPQILPKCPETQPGGWGHQQLPPAPSTPHPVRPLPTAQRPPLSPARPVTVRQPGAPSFSPHPGDREGPEPGGSFVPVCPSVPLSVHCPQHPTVML